MKQKKFIRIMALILCLIMVLGMIPAIAHAEEAPVLAGSAYKTDVALPDMVLEDMEASATGLANVYDFAAYSTYQSPGGYEGHGHEIKTDADSQFGKAWTYNAWHKSDGTADTAQANIGGVHIRNGSGWGILASIYTGEIIQDGEYHWYKRTITVPAAGATFLFPFGWSSQLPKITSAINSYMAGSKVDVYIRMKIEGSISNTTDPAKGPI